MWVFGRGGKFLGLDETATDGLSVTFNASTLGGPGTYKTISRVYGTNDAPSNWVAHDVVVTAPTARDPLITSFVITPNPVRQGQTLTLEARVDDPDNTVNFVQFVWDRDDSESVTTGDSILGNGSRSGSVWTLPITVTDDYRVGVEHFIARVRYGSNTEWADVEARGAQIDPPPNSEPNVGALAADFTVRVRGLTVTLTAHGVSGPRPVTAKFYRDSNGNGTLESNDGPGDDQFLGSDDDGSNGYSIPLGTSSFPLGRNRFFVQPEHGVQQGNYVSTTITLTPPDNEYPQATLMPTLTVNQSGGTAYGFQILLEDNVAIDSTTIGDGDVQVTGPGEFFRQVATLVSVDTPGDQPSLTATYLITPPGGSWDFTDNGTYKISLLNNQVSDTSAHFFPFTPLGTFVVSVPDGTPPDVNIAGLSADVNLPTLKNVSTFDVTGSASDAESGIAAGHFHFFLSAYGNGYWGEPVDLGPGGSSVTLQSLSDGLYAVALQAENGAGLTASSANAFFIVDTTPPTASIGAVASPRNDPVESVTIAFSELVTGFDRADLQLQRDGGANLLTGSQTLVAADSLTWTLSLLGITDTPGDYVLKLTAASSEILDRVGNALATDARATWHVNHPPTLSDIHDQPTDEDTTTAAIPFTVGDAETPVSDLVVSVSSSDTALVPVANIAIGGSGANRTLTITPARDGNGPATIGVTITDGNGATTSGSFVLTVKPVNDAPLISAIAKQTTDEDASTAAISFTVSDVDNAAGQLIVTGSSSNTVVVPTSNITLSGSGADRTVTIVPAENKSGDATNTLTVSDGLASSSTSFVVTVNPVNDAPTPGDDTRGILEDSSLVMTDTELLANDTDVEGDSLTIVGVSCQNCHGAISSRSVNGKVTITFQPSANFNGSVALGYTVEDPSHDRGTGVIHITVDPVNDAPVAVNDVYSIMQAGLLDVVVPGVLGNDSDVEGSALTATLVSGAASGTLTFRANGSFTYRPNDGFTGIDQFVYRTSDGLLNSNDATVTIIVNPTVIASDDFASGNLAGGVGWLGPWTASGDYSVYNFASPHSGSYHLRLRSSTGYAMRCVDLSGFVDVHFQFWAKIDFSATGAQANVLVSPDGSVWSSVKTFRKSDSDNVYHAYDIPLSGFSMTPRFCLAVDADMSTTFDRIYVDDVQLFTTKPRTPALFVSDATVWEGDSGSTSAEFTVTLSPPSDQVVTVDYATSDGSATAPNDYTSISTTTLTFAPGETKKTFAVLVSGDTIDESDESFSVTLSNATVAGITDGTGIGTIRDDDPAPKFFVVNNDTDATFEYAASGQALTNTALAAGNADPRGIAADAAGTTVWVIDKNKSVYVYDSHTRFQDSWTAGSLSSPEGITVSGNDLWIVDKTTRKVYRYDSAATRRSGSQNPTSNFTLTALNYSPSDVASDGISVWVPDSIAKKVFKYTMAGTLLGSWGIDSANTTPTGIAIDPSGASSSIWLVDSQTDRVYEYANARSRTSGSQSASVVFNLASGNVNAQGIADPPGSTAADQVPQLAPRRTRHHRHTISHSLKGIGAPSGSSILVNTSPHGRFDSAPRQSVAEVFDSLLESGELSSLRSSDRIEALLHRIASH